MAYLELAPAIAALRARPEDFECSDDTLHHLRSGHRFRFLREDEVLIEALCNCATLRTRSDEARVLHRAWCDWLASYWQPLQVNRQFAAHFAPPSPWRRCAEWLLRRLLTLPAAQGHGPAPAKADLPLQPVA